jgi:23S rRNA pseudouridine1911/1915/1917 synthase
MDQGTPPIELVVSADEDELRLDQFIHRRIPGISRGSIRRLLEQKQVIVDGHYRSKGTRLEAGQRVLVASVARSERPVPQPELSLETLAIYPEMVAINKRPGMPCHPLVPGETDTVANALAARFPECVDASPQPREGGLVHRLDWSTSGVLMAARDRESYGRLRGMFSSGRVVKDYLALVMGVVDEPGRISSLLRTASGDRTRMEVSFKQNARARGRQAESQFWPRHSLGQRTLLQVRCTTGVRHQVRAHLAHAGHPLVGDSKYGGQPIPGDRGAFLHAWRIQLPDDDLELRAPLPPVRQQILTDLGAPTLEMVEEPRWANETTDDG